MGILHKVGGGTARAAGAGRGSKRENEREAKAAREALLTMGLPRVNLLLEGQERALQGVLDALAGSLRQPVSSWHPGQRLELPLVERQGTMIIHDVDALGIEEQIHLLEWLGHAVGRTQVVSTSTAPLLPRVHAGAFIDTLYYRLNTVFLDVTPR
jgi:hypothetical protein